MSEDRGLFDGGLHVIPVGKLVKALQNCNFGPEELTFHQIGEVDQFPLCEVHGPREFDASEHVLHDCYQTLDTSYNSPVLQAINDALKGPTSTNSQTPSVRTMIDFDIRSLHFIFIFTLDYFFTLYFTI